MRAFMARPWLARAMNARSMSAALVCSSSRAGVSAATIQPLAHEHELVEAPRLVHDVRRDDQRPACWPCSARRNFGGQPSARRTGSRPTVGSSRTSSSGSPSSATARRRRERSPRRRAARVLGFGLIAQEDELDDLGAARIGHAEDAREVREVLAHSVRLP